MEYDISILFRKAYNKINWPPADIPYKDNFNLDPSKPWDSNSYLILLIHAVISSIILKKLFSLYLSKQLLYSIFAVIYPNLANLTAKHSVSSFVLFSNPPPWTNKIIPLLSFFLLKEEYGIYKS